ncbi:MAG: tetratricopeptide repeat protein [Polyangiaceae bacterium]
MIRKSIIPAFGLVLSATALSSVAAADGAASSSASGGVCIEEKAKKELNACAVAGPKEFAAHGKQTQANFRGVAPIGDPKKKDNKPPSPVVNDAPRDERKSKLQARQRALLFTEIQGIERLFQNTPRNAADRVTLARRLAEAYVELEAAAFRDKTNAEMERDNLKKANPQGAGQKQALANQADQVMKSARNQAIRYYTLVKTDYPDYAQLDEVLYYLAYEHEQANDYKTARTVYLELKDKRPNSKYIPNVYLAFGELFFNEAQGDPSKWDLAGQAYESVIKYPPPNNKVYGYAWYKLGYVAWNKGEFEKAMNAFKKTIDFGKNFSQLPGASKLADSARKDIIPVYALKGDPTQAYNFFHNISGDTDGNEKTFKMMDDLGNNYLDTGHYPEGIALYKDLMNRDKSGDKSCVYQSHITEATMAMKSSNKEAIKNEVDQQVKLYKDFASGGHSAEAKQECANHTAQIVAETAMAWHLEAAGSGGQRGTNDPKTLSLAAYLYKRVVDTFDAKQFSTFTFPRIVKDDWPTLYKIKYNMADLLYYQEKWAECGPAFDSVVAEDPTGKDAPEAAYASVLCYQKMYDASHPKAEARKGIGQLPGKNKSEEEKRKKEEEAAALKPKEFTEQQKGMVQAFNRYICYIKPPATDNAGQEQLVEVKYARARTYFEAKHWEEAATAFRDIAMNNADRDVGIYAAQLYLESVNVLGTQSSRPSCYDDMAVDVPKFLELYCTGDKAAKNAEQCTNLNKVQVDILRLKAQKLVEIADKNGGAGALQQYETAGNTYFEMFRKYCQEPVQAGQQPQADRCDEIAYNAARSFQAARLIAKAIAARQSLLAFDAKTNGKSPLAKKATYEIGGNYQAIAVYELAADWFEKFVDADPRAEKADTALADAVLLRLGLGQEDKAIEDARKFQKNYGASKPAQTAAIAFAIGAHYVEKAEGLRPGAKAGECINAEECMAWEKARASLQGSMGVIDKAAPDIQVQAHGALARTYAHLKNGGKLSKTEYGKVRSLWSNPADAEAKIRAAYGSEDAAQQDKRLAKALNAVGEAFFMAAEDERIAVVEPVKFPEYKGSGTKEDVVKHIQTKVKEWYTKKKESITKVEPAYVKILDLKPVPPPKWVIAAGSRSGLMWGNFVDDFRRAPIPKAWKTDPEIRGTYYDALDAASEPFKVGNAKPALKKCLDLSVKYQYFDNYSRDCEVWLAKNYKAEYHVVDELRGAPTLSNSGLDEKNPPILVGGQAWRPPSAAPTEKAGAEQPAAKPGDTKKPAPAGKKK